MVCALLASHLRNTIISGVRVHKSSGIRRWASRSVITPPPVDRQSTRSTAVTYIQRYVCALVVSLTRRYILLTLAKQQEGSFVKDNWIINREFFFKRDQVWM